MDSSMNINQFDIAWQYLNASKTILESMICCKNERFVVRDHTITEEEHYQATRYNSNSIMTPALFCLYQAIELLLKGFATFKTGNRINTHDINELVCDLESLMPNEMTLVKCFADILDTPPLFVKTFMDRNSIGNLKLLYFSLRYPDQKDATGYNYWFLHYPEDAYPGEFENNKVEAFLQELKVLLEKMDNLLKEAVRVYRSERINYGVANNINAILDR